MADYDFNAIALSDERRQVVEQLHCPAQNILTCGWNNAPRYRDNFTELEVPDSEEFSLMLLAALDNKKYSQDIPLLCNAWNEWSEGAAIEPCSYLGDGLLSGYMAGLNNVRKR